MEQEEHIVADPNVMLGKPVVGGTRVTVQSVVERCAYMGATGVRIRHASY